MWMALHDNKYTNILCYSLCSFSSFGHLAFQSLLIYLPLKYSVIFSPFFCPATRRDTYYFRLAFSIHVVACYCIYSLLFYTYTQQHTSTVYSLLYSALFSRWSTLGRAVANRQGFFSSWTSGLLTNTSFLFFRHFFLYRRYVLFLAGFCTQFPCHPFSVFFHGVADTPPDGSTHIIESIYNYVWSCVYVKLSTMLTSL